MPHQNLQFVEKICHILKKFRLVKAKKKNFEIAKLGFDLLAKHVLIKFFPKIKVKTLMAT